MVYGLVSSDQETNSMMTEWENILEIGSWIWWFYQFIREYKSSYIGVEMDSDAVQWSNDYFWNKFICSSFEDFTWKDFDLIFAFEVLEHLLHPLESIDKIYNLLNVWGLFIWSSPIPILRIFMLMKLIDFVYIQKIEKAF